MLKKVIIGLIIALILFTYTSRRRVGAFCRDGSSSLATGSGACSWHGGVSEWKYKYWWEK